MECAVDACQSSYWRTRLFDSKAGEVFELSRADLSGLQRRATFVIKKFGLRISAAVSDTDTDTDTDDVEPWLSENGAVIFKFWATDFPMVSFYSGNNPAIR